MNLENVFKTGYMAVRNLIMIVVLAISFGYANTPFLISIEFMGKGACSCLSCYRSRIITRDSIGELCCESNKT